MYKRLVRIPRFKIYDLKMDTIMDITKIILLVCVFASSMVQAESIVIPTHAEAKDAILDMLDMRQIKHRADVKLGTCVAVQQARHEHQVACTILLTVGISHSEMQADFFKTGKVWKAQASFSQYLLPIPDSKFTLIKSAQLLK